MSIKSHFWSSLEMQTSDCLKSARAGLLRAFVLAMTKMTSEQSREKYIVLRMTEKLLPSKVEKNTFAIKQWRGKPLGSNPNKKTLRREFFYSRLEGFEPPTFWFVAKRSIQLGYKRLFSSPI